MGIFSKSENHWRRNNTMRVLILLLMCASVITGVATVETVRTMNTLAIIALSLSLIGAIHLTIDILILTYSPLNKIYVAILYSILIVCWIGISGVEFVEIGDLGEPKGAFSLKIDSNNPAGCNVKNMTFNWVPGEPYVTHCTLPIVRCSVSWAMVVLYIAASVYITREEKRPKKMLGRSEAQGEEGEEGPGANSPQGICCARVMRAVIREQDGEMPKTSLDRDYSKDGLEKVSVQYVKD